MEPIPFEPVPVQPRHDGWTRQRQVDFIQALVETGCVIAACRRIGMSDTSAYALRLRPRAESFRRAWDSAIDVGAMPRLEQAVYDRGINGVPRPVFYKGEQVGEYRHFDERLAMFLLRARRPDRYGKWMDRMLADDARTFEQGPRDLDGHLDGIEWGPSVGHGDEDESE